MVVYLGGHLIKWSFAFARKKPRMNSYMQNHYLSKYYKELFLKGITKLRK